MVCRHSICFRSNRCGQIRAAEPSKKASIGGADLRHQSRAEWIGIMENKNRKRCDIIALVDQNHAQILLTCGGKCGAITL
jgi:hypothetical protein